jgi:hypothetical protein
VLVTARLSITEIKCSGAEFRRAACHGMEAHNDRRVSHGSSVRRSHPDAHEGVLTADAHEGVRRGEVCTGGHRVGGGHRTLAASAIGRHDLLLIAHYYTTSEYVWRCRLCVCVSAPTAHLSAWLARGTCSFLCLGVWLDSFSCCRAIHACTSAQGLACRMRSRIYLRRTSRGAGGAWRSGLSLSPFAFGRRIRMLPRITSSCSTCKPNTALEETQKKAGFL